MEGNFSGGNVGKFGKSSMIHQTKNIQRSNSYYTSGRWFQYCITFNYIISYPYPIDTPDIPPQPQPTVVERNPVQPEDKPPPGVTLCC